MAVTYETSWSSLQEAAWALLQEQDPDTKCQLGIEIEKLWSAGDLPLEEDGEALALPIPGRPEQPELLSPHKMPKRSVNSDKGRVVLMHAVAHIEFNAINLAWDAVYRFRGMPKSYYDDWISVGLDEARHFQMLNGYLKKRDSFYGEYPAHNGLWDMAVKTDADVLVRMALVPRVLEARGLDVTPGMLAKLKKAGDQEAIGHLNIILEEEINHVRIGTHWYHYCCEQRDLPKRETFVQLINEYMQTGLKGPFNIEARLLAGFDEDELSYLEEMQ